MPHFSYQVDRLLDQGSSTKHLIVMVRDVELRGSSQLPIISMTLLNSRLQGSKQIDLSLSEADFTLLGPINSGNKPIAPLSTLQNQFSQLGLSPYASTLPVSAPLEQKFDFMKLREI